MSTKLMVGNLTHQSVHKVRRRLFEEKDEGSRHAKPAQSSNEQSGSKAANEQLAFNILIVTTFEESGEIQLLSAHATYLNNNTNVLYCLPDDALQQCNQVNYKVIFTDVDLSRNNEMLRIITSIRKRSLKNKDTPIIAVHQRHHNHANDLDYYGITDVYKGDLNHIVVKEILDKYKIVFESTDPLENDETVLTSEKKNLNEKVSVSSPSLPNSNSSEKKEDFFFPAPKSPSGMVSSSCLLNNTSGKASIKTINKDFAPIHPRNLYRTTIPRIKPPKELHSFYQPPTNDAIRKYPFMPVNQTLNPSYNIPYMVSGAPGSADMKITMIPDDVTKHSTKERLRRERIKECCDQMRDMLPKLHGHSRKIDMATVLELTVLYIRIIQMHSPALVYDQCSQIFQSFCRQVTEKNKYSEEAIIKGNTRSSKTSHDTKSSMLSVTNHVYLNNHQRCSEESVSPFTQHLRTGHFQPIEYFSIGVPTANDLYQQQLSQQIQYAASSNIQKDHLFTDNLSIHPDQSQSIYGSHF